MPAHKGQKKVGGRKKGTPNKATAGLKAAFQEHEEELVKGLLALTKSDDEHVSLGALKACFDRGWGRPPQPMTDAEGEGPPIVEIRRIIVDPAPSKGNGADPGHTDGGGIPAPTHTRPV